MYNPANLEKPTKKDVYKVISEYDIFVQYLGYKPIVGKVYKSPFRFDLNPSFGLFRARNGNLLFKDLGSGESGNAIKFAKLLEGHHSTQETIEYLYRQYKKLKPKRTRNVPEIKPGIKEIYTNKIPFTEEGLSFWLEFGIKKETLDYFEVYQIDKYYVNGRLSGWTNTDNPMFVFEIYDRDKIYRPKYKAKRFYTNCTMEYIQGWEQLDYSKDTVIITKSLKDVMYLYQLGYTAIAPNGEGHSIPQKVIKELKKNFKYIIVFYDWDKAGLCGTRKLIRQNPEFGFIFTGIHSMKDATDMHLVLGEKDTAKILNQRIKYSKQHHFK